MVPGDQLDRFLSIFEEARYSDHDIGPTHRDGAIQTLQMISDSITIALGEEGRIERTDEHTSICTINKLRLVCLNQQMEQ